MAASLAGRSAGSHLALLAPLLVAALPSLLVLQVLPRTVEVQANPNAAAALGLGGLLVPVAAAAAAGGLAALLGRGPGTVVAAAAMAQAAGMPTAVDLSAAMVQAGLWADAAFWPALFASHVTLSVAAAWYAARWMAGAPSAFTAPLGWVAATAMVALGAFFLLWVLALAYVGAGVWYHLLALCAAAGALAFTVVRRSAGLPRSLGWGLAIAAAGVTAFTLAVEVSLLVSPPPVIDLSGVEPPA